jgi:single-stranded-DNA-specific exonuclease
MKWLQRTPEKKLNKRDDVMKQISKIRGIKDTYSFLKPTEDELHDPYLLKNIEDASNRIIRAIANNERILVTYDPDADGLTATTVMRRYLANYTDNVDYIYGERSEGHGIFEMIRANLDKEEDAERIARNKENKKKIKESDLIILIDSSSNDTKACYFISKKLGKEIIILDHHEIEERNPYALIVNPQQKGCKYPNKQLSGAGVVFKTIQVMEDTLNQVDPWQYIDLVAVGMYADMMRVDVMENRYLILKGMKNMKNGGLVRILKSANTDMFRISCTTIGFTIAPLLNGVARLDELHLAIDLLMSDEDKEQKRLRLKMHKLNEERKVIQKELFERYSQNIDPSKKVLIVTDDQSSKGFNGLVSQSLSDAYSRPAIVGRLHKGKLSGSFRSYDGFDFKTFIQGFGHDIVAKGHKGAGGIEVLEEHIPALEEYIEKNMPDKEKKGTAKESKEPELVYDLEISAEDVHKYAKDVERMNILTGEGFPRIKVRVNDVVIEEVIHYVKATTTAKFTTSDTLELIKFRVDEQYGKESEKKQIHVVGELGMNEWYNFATKKKTVKPQVILDEYKIVGA